jgi:hypothetical protein
VCQSILIDGSPGTFSDRRSPLLSAASWWTLHFVSTPFLNVPAADIVARIRVVASAAADGPVVVRVGDDVHGYRNVAVDLPRGRRSAAEGRRLRNRVWTALEAAGVVMAETAGAPKVGGDLRGNVQAPEVAPNWADASGLVRAPQLQG